MTKTCLQTAPQHVGLPTCRRVFGFVSGFVRLVAYSFLPSLVVGAIALALLLWMTGLHHTDGLLDSATASWCMALRRKKIEVMHDQLTGARRHRAHIDDVYGYCLRVCRIRSSRQLWRLLVCSPNFPALITVELGAKLAMVVAAWAAIRP
jgi:cobalamin synthase